MLTTIRKVRLYAELWKHLFTILVSGVNGQREIPMPRARLKTFGTWEAPRGALKDETLAYKINEYAPHQRSWTNNAVLRSWELKPHMQ